MKCPNWLGKTGKKYWKDFVGYLKDDRQAPTLYLLCQTYEDWHNAREHIQANGQTQKQGDRFYVNPAVAVSNEAQKQILRLTKALRLPPFDNSDAPAPDTGWGEIMGETPRDE